MTKLQGRSMPANLLSAVDLNRAQVLELVELADNELAPDGTLAVQERPIDTAHMGGLLFFEESVRTRIGFEAAAWKLGIKTVSLYETKVNDSMSTAESIPDTIRTLNPLVNFFCVRHPDPNIFEQITPYTEHPVINAGSGYVEHPTQALVDAFAVWKHFGRLDRLNITMVGALRYSRVARSLIDLFGKFSEIHITAVAEPELQLTDTDLKPFMRSRNKGQRNSYQTAPETDWSGQEIVYCAGFPPKLPSGEYSQAVRDKYRITADAVEAMDDQTIVMNALPRIDEITPEVDGYTQAYYFRQNQLALPMRMAIIQKFCL